MSSDKTSRRREIEDTTAARLAEIVAGAERAAKQVIDEAEADARARLADAEDEADRIVAERLAALVALTAEVEAQAEELRRGAEALGRALAEVRVGLGGPEALGGSASLRGAEVPPTAQRPSSPSLTVVGGHPVEPPEPIVREVRAAEVDAVDADLGRDGVTDFGESGRAAAGNGVEAGEDGLAAAESGATPAGARLLATQMAVSGSSREEIAARLRTGFAIEDTAPILDAILGPEK